MLTLCEPAESVTVSTALSRPTTDGVNFTLFAHEPPPPASKEPPQLLVCEKSEAFMPEMATVKTLVGKEPRLVSITVSVLEVPSASRRERQRVGKKNGGCCRTLHQIRHGANPGVVQHH